MAAILLLLLLATCPSTLEGSPSWSISQMLEVAEHGDLPSEFSTTYVDRHGHSHLIHWMQNSTPDLYDVHTYDGIQLKKIQPLDSKSYIGRFNATSNSGFALLHDYKEQTDVILSSTEFGNVFISKKNARPVQYKGENDYISDKTHRTDCHPTAITSNEINTRGSGISTCKKVYVSVTADYDLYLQFGRNTTAVTNYVKSVISTVQAVYRREEIQIGISEIIIHTKEDGFRHWTALDDLTFFRFTRRSFQGDIALCLGGFKDGTGFAPLGGHAYLSSLCAKLTSYALVNVDGVHANYPNFSWDIFGVAHELGHVLGSEHTHACVWGPSKNQSIDNCSSPVGGCAPGPSVSKGTIMSYCHLPGGPGVSFASGFGVEPGNLLRNKIANSSCLSDYIPTNILAKSPKTLTANMECHDGSFTHYYFDNNTSSESDDILLLSIDKKDQDIGHVYDGSLTIQTTYTSRANSGKGQTITAPYVNSSKKFVVAQKYWKITPQRMPSSSVTVKVPYLNSDYTDLNNSVIQPLTIEQIKVVNMVTPADPNPISNHRNATTARTQMLSYGSRITGSQYRHSQSQGNHYFEFSTTKLNGGGIGVYEDSALPAEVLDFSATRCESDVKIKWKTASENGVQSFQLQSSLDGLEYSAIHSEAAIGLGSEYHFDDVMNDGRAMFYRLQVSDFDGSKEQFSPVFVEKWEDDVISTPTITNNILENNSVEIQLPQHWANTRLTLTSPSGQILFEQALDDDGTHQVSFPNLPMGMYFLQLKGQDVINFKVVQP